jgi:1-aminocyclopropane-1-carboxylate deaminase/D-cysteine desulfhydrase-like pyridoxal-dependent ACC family enzyme
MVTVNAALMQTQFHITNSDADCEAVLDGAINLLNTFGADLTNLTAGSGTYTSKQAGAIMSMAQQIYARQYVNPAETSSVNLGPAGIGYGSSTQLLAFAEKLAERLKSSSIAFVVANDTSGLT